MGYPIKSIGILAVYIKVKLRLSNLNASYVSIV